MDLEALEQQAAALTRKLDARRGSPGFAENVREIEAALVENTQEIARLRAQAPEAA